MKDPINLNNPIFVYYFDIANMSRQRCEESISDIYNKMSNTSYTLWVVPCTYTKVECIYDGLSLSGSRAKRIYNTLKKILDNTPSELKDNDTLLEIKSEIRNLLIDDIFENVKE